MLLLVGLGNPGPEHASNRHNVGFMAVNAIARAHGFHTGKRQFHGLVADGHLGGERTLLLKPTTYMNLSGRAVGELCRYFHITTEDVVVFHDELDLPLGKIRMKKGGGNAGHNGLRSIDAEFGPGYRRCRIGIGHPGVREAVLAWVLRNFSAEERMTLDPVLDAIAAEAPLLAEGKDSTFASKVALRTASPKPGTVTGSA